MKSLTYFAVLAAFLASVPASAARLRLCMEALTPEHAEQIARRGWSDAAQMESNLDALWAQCLEERGGDEAACERAGVFGPESMIWEVSKVTFLALFSEFQLYLELAHPPSIQGVVDWSPALKKDPVRRFQHTLDVLWSMTYGTFSEARERALRMHGIHSRITGTMDEGWGSYFEGDLYSALDPESQLWIHATHWHAVLKTYETLERPLTAEEKERYFADTKKFGMLMGINPDLVPGTAAEFERYFQGMIESGKLHFTEVALAYEKHFREMSAVQETKNPLLRVIRENSDAITAELLPPGLARQVGLRRGLRQRVTQAAGLRAVRTAWRLTPLMLTVNPLYNMARQRALQENATIFDFIDEWLYGRMVGRRAKPAKDK